MTSRRSKSSAPTQPRYDDSASEPPPRPPLEIDECLGAPDPPDDGTLSPASDPAPSRDRTEQDDAGPPPQERGAAAEAAASSPARSIDDFLEEAYRASSPPSDRVESSLQSPSSPTSVLGSLTARRAYWASILSLGVANSSDASEILCVSYMLSDPDFDEHILRGDVAWRGGLLAGSVFLGMLIGGLVVGAAADRWGRRPTLLFGLVSNSVAGTLSALAPDAVSLSAVRFVAGVGIGATVPPLFTLVTELSPPSRRGFFVTVVASFWMVGSVYVALVALASFQLLGWSWRWFAALCAAPSAAGAACVWSCVPPSPRFLASSAGRHGDACDAANEIARRMMGSPSPPAASAPHRRGHRPGGGRFRPLEVEEVRRHYPRGRGRDQSCDDDDDLRSPTLSSLMGETRREFVRGARGLYAPRLRFGATVPLQVVWFSLSFGSYGLLTWINSIFVRVHLRDVYVNALLFALANLPGNVLSAVLVERLGRRVTLTLVMALGAASLASFAWYARDSPEEGGGEEEDGEPNVNTIGIVLSACAFQAFSIAGWNALDVMTGETFPTSVRGTGMGICTASGRVGALAAQFVNGLLVRWPAALLLVAGAMLTVGALTPCALAGEDRAGRGLEDEVAGAPRERKDHLSDEDNDDHDGGAVLRDEQRSGYVLLSTSYSSMDSVGAGGRPSGMLMV